MELLLYGLLPRLVPPLFWLSLLFPQIAALDHSTVNLQNTETIQQAFKDHRCTETNVNVVAHQDDDLLFMNPDISKDIGLGICTVTIYITAGDANAASSYWRKREQGSRAAYAYMSQAPNEWTTTTFEASDMSIVGYKLKAAPVLLLFFRLPDGSTRGNGFSKHQYESVEKLWRGQITDVHALDTHASWSKSQIVSTLKTILTTLTVNTLRTLEITDADPTNDHSDHITSAAFVNEAITSGTVAHTLLRYKGYPLSGEAPNLTDTQMQKKRNIFFHYAPFDDYVCQDETSCKNTRISLWFSRQYSLTD